MATAEFALLSLTLGVPVSLMAIALLANACVARCGCMPAPASTRAPNSTVGGPAEARRIADPSNASDGLRSQLTCQLDALGGMLASGAVAARGPSSAVTPRRAVPSEAAAHHATSHFKIARAFATPGCREEVTQPNTRN